MNSLGKYILRYRQFILIFWIGTILTALYFAPKLTTDYGVIPLLSKSHPAFVDFDHYKQVFGEEDLVYIIGIEKTPLKDLSLFEQWNSMAHQIEQIDGVDTVISPTYRLAYFEKDTLHKKLNVIQLKHNTVKTKEDLDTFRRQVYQLPFYKN